MGLLFARQRRLWLVSFVAIVVIVAVGTMIARSSPSHVPSPVLVRLAAAAIVTACAAVAKLAFGPRAAAATAIVGVAITVTVLILFR